jgi:hypothetical protein
MLRTSTPVIPERVDSQADVVLCPYDFRQELLVLGGRS